MNDIVENSGGALNLPWRAIGWGSAVVLLSLPFFAMRFTNSGVNWSSGDFIFAGAAFAIIGGLLELAVRASGNWTYRLAFGLSLLGSLLTVWVTGAVGIVGSEDNAANLLFIVAILIGVGGAIGARLRADGMARAALTTSVAIVIAFFIAETAPRDEPVVSQVTEAVGTSVFVLLFLASAWLFRRAAAHSSSSS